MKILAISSHLLTPCWAPASLLRPRVAWGHGIFNRLNLLNPFL